MNGCMQDMLQLPRQALLMPQVCLQMMSNRVKRARTRKGNGAAQLLGQPQTSWPELLTLQLIPSIGSEEQGTFIRLDGGMKDHKEPVELCVE